MRRTEYQILLATLAAITFAAGSVIIGFQIVIREQANEPQRQMIDTFAAELRQSTGDLSIASHPKIDVASSQAPFVIVYDESKRVVASDAVLHETYPRIPDGVLAATDNGQINAITWNPEGKIRLATVVQQVSARGHNYYILSARSLASAETLKDQVLFAVLTGWGTVVLLLGVAAYFEGQRTKAKS